LVAQHKVKTDMTEPMYKLDVDLDEYERLRDEYERLREESREKKRAEIRDLKSARMGVDVSTLEVTADLKDWVEMPTSTGEFYCIWGTAANDSKGRFPDGHIVRTSAIVKVEEGIAVTLNSAYRLLSQKETT